MRAAVFHGPGELHLEEVPDPVAGPGEVVLDVLADTLCGTDVRLLRGEKTAAPGTILGHEVSGRVAEVGEGVTTVAVGDQVAVVPSITCGTCWYCTHDLEMFCTSYRLVGYEVHGGLAEKMLVPADLVARGNLIRTDAEFELGALSLAEPLSCVLNGFREYGVAPGETVVVLGAGPIGLLHAQLARRAGARHVVVTNRSAPRREHALRLGATHAVDPTSEDLDALVRDLTDGRGADAVVQAIGVPDLFGQALALARPGGRVNAFAGFPKGGTATLDPNLIHYGQLAVTGGSNSRRSDAADAVALMESGQIEVNSMVTHRFALEDVREAIEFQASGEALKIAVVPHLDA